MKQINKLRTRRGNSLGRCLYSQLALPDGLPRPRGRHRVGFALFLFSAREGGLRERGEVAIMQSRLCLAGFGCRACFVAFFTCGMPHTSAGSYDFASHPTISECSSISAFLSRELFQHKKIQCWSTDSVSAERDGFALRAEFLPPTLTTVRTVTAVSSNRSP